MTTTRSKKIAAERRQNMSAELWNNAYVYRVRGRGLFPFDQLRYDRAVPNSEKDSNAIRSTYLKRESVVTLRSTQLPEVMRWLSFGWTVIMVAEQ